MLDILFEILTWVITPVLRVYIHFINEDPELMPTLIVPTVVLQFGYWFVMYTLLF